MFWLIPGMAETAAAIGAGVELSSKDDKGSHVSYPNPVDYSAASAVASDNAETVALGQIMTQRFALQQAAMDRELQRAANLELSIEKMDTRLQVGLMQFKQMMQAEENKRVETIVADAAKFQSMTSPTPPPDLPTPAFHSDFEREGNFFKK